MTPLKAIVLDLDDTLYPEWTYVKSGFRAVASYIAEKLDGDEEHYFGELWDLFERGVRGSAFDIFLEKLGIKTADWISQLVTTYRNHSPQIELYEDALPLLSSLKPRFKSGLVSDGLLVVQQRKFAALGLAEYFDCVIFSDVFGRGNWKPSALPFQRVCGGMNATPETVVYVADNPLKDFKGARETGMRTVRVRRADGLHAAEEAPAEPFQPDGEISGLAELNDILQKMFILPAP